MIEILAKLFELMTYVGIFCFGVGVGAMIIHRKYYKDSEK